MAHLTIKPGATSVTTYVKINDLSNADNSGKTGLAYNTSSFTAYYVRDATASAAITLATQTTTGAWSSGGFVEVDATNMPGVYRFDIPDAVIASGKRQAVVTFRGASDMVQTDLIIDLGGDVNVTRWNGTAVPSEDTAGYPKVTIKNGTGTGEVSLASGRANADVAYWNGSAVATPDTAGYPKITIKSGTGTGEISLSSGGVTLKSQAIASGTFAADAIDSNAIAATAASEIATAVGAVVVESNNSIPLTTAVRTILSATAGVTASGGTVLKDPSGTTTRITATIDGSNNRTAMTIS